jgi:hypothetical protein
MEGANSMRQRWTMITISQAALIWLHASVSLILIEGKTTIYFLCYVHKSYSIVLYIGKISPNFALLAW